VSKKGPQVSGSKQQSESKADRRKAALAELRRQQEKQRRNRLFGIVAVVVAVVVIVGVAAVVALNRNGGSGAKTTTADSKLVNTLTTIPGSTYDKVGAGTVSNGPKAVTGVKALTENGKPKVLYVGAEYCPYCAAERWAMVTALARFGTFSNLGQTTSSHADVYPDTPTLSFHGSSFTSKYLAFKGYETQSNQVQGNSYAPLDKLSQSDGTTFDTYDRPPYLATDGSIPFIDFGGKYLQQGASYSPQLLHGMTHQQVADQIADPTTDISKSVLGTANAMTAAICTLTNDKPADVCTSQAVTAAQSSLQQ
jgi:hypothetical protein